MTRKNFFRVAAICAVFNIAAAQSVNAYSINLSIERKEMCVSQIPADRKVSLAISINNNPETDQLSLTIMKDPALKFASFLPISNLDPAFDDNFACSAAYDNPDATSVSLWCESGKYSGNNTLGHIDVFIPQEAAAGSFYPVDLIADKGLYIYYTNENGDRNYLVSDSFNLTNGGIKINPDPQPEPAPPAPNVQPQAPAPAQPDPAPAPAPAQQQPDNIAVNAPVQTAAPDPNNAKSSQATSVSSVVPGSSDSSSLPSEKNVSQKSSSLSESKKSSDTTKISSAQTKESASETSSVSKDKDTDNKSKTGVIPFIAAAVVLAAAAAIIIIKIKGKKK